MTTRKLLRTAFWSMAISCTLGAALALLLGFGLIVGPLAEYATMGLLGFGMISVLVNLGLLAILSR